MRFLLAAILMALVAAPAQAQHMRGKKGSPNQEDKNGEAKKKAQDADRAYKAALDKQPNQKPADPWHNMR